MHDWIRQSYVTNIRIADPDGAVGKLFRAFLNARGIQDPLTRNQLGVGEQKMPSAKHHIFPSKWVHHLAGWEGSNDSENLALNIMYVEIAANGR